MSAHEQPAPGRSPAVTEDITEVDDRRRAETFFVGWLIVAASMSLAGNVGHALLIAPADTRWLSALAALVPPIALLAATHSATWLVRARSVGWVYWVALALTAALALGSFALSFDALRSFAVMLGIRQAMSWIWPAVIDVAIAHATLCLLSLSRPKHAATTSREGTGPATVSETATSHAKMYSQNTPAKTVEFDRVPPHPVSLDLRAPSVPSAPKPIVDAGRSACRNADSSVERATGTRGFDVSVPMPSKELSTGAATGATQWPERGLSAVPAGEDVPPRVASPNPVATELDTNCDAAVERWQPVARSLVRDGITTKNPDLIAKILADSEAGTPPSTIGRRHEVHHTTVNRILSAAEHLTEAGTATG